MKCPRCNTEMIWQNDCDFEDCGITDEEGIMTTEHCPNCNVTVEIYAPTSQKEIIDE